MPAWVAENGNVICIQLTTCVQVVADWLRILNQNGDTIAEDVVC